MITLYPMNATLIVGGRLSRAGFEPGTPQVQGDYVHLLSVGTIYSNFSQHVKL